MTYRPTLKTEQRKEAMRQRLLQAARTLFTQQGYEATTLQQIVKEAGTSIGNCYFYFANKEALLLEIAEDLRREITQEIDQAIAPLSPGPGLLVVAVYAGTLAVLKRSDAAKFALTDNAHPSLRPFTMALFASRAQRAFEAMPELLAGWKDATPQMAASAWHGGVNYVLEGIITGRIEEEPTRAARFVARWSLNALGLSASKVQQAMETLATYVASDQIQVSLGA